MISLLDFDTVLPSLFECDKYSRLLSPFWGLGFSQNSYCKCHYGPYFLLQKNKFSLIQCASCRARGCGDTEKTVYVKGFHTDQAEELIRNNLEARFADCGRIFNTRLPTEKDWQIKGFSYVEFS
ncbi:unnamed protein product [Calypogeia fissa]